MVKQRKRAAQAAEASAAAEPRERVEAVDPLAHEPFAWRVAKDGHVQISYEGKVVTVLRGPAATKAVARLEKAATGAAEQQVMARLTGNFKRGNER